jgi:hypothetical protein
VDVPRYTLRRLRRSDKDSSKYLDAVMDRIGSTSRQFDGSGDALVNSTWKLYAENSPLLGLWVATDDLDDDIVGHALGDIEQWSGRTVAWISQVMMDMITPQSIKLSAMAAFDNWVDEVNEWAVANKLPWKVTEILMMSPRMSESWARHSGFDLYRQVYRRLVR